MLSPPSSVRVFIAVGPIDMRGSFDAVAGAARRLGLDPVDGHLYVFTNKRRRIVKALWFDSTGWCVLSNRLERGSFQWPQVAEGVTRVAVTPAMLTSLLAGFDFTAPRKRWFGRAT